MSVDKFARRLDQVEKDVKAVATQPRLHRSSIDGGALELRDRTGATAGYVGEQFDGTVTSAAVGGTWPSRPTTPYVMPVAGGLRIYWDGTYDDDSVTRMDFKRVTFHAVTDVDNFDPLDPSQIVGEVGIATGGEVAVALPYVEHFVFAVTWTDAGKFSEPSDVAFGTPSYVTQLDIDPNIDLGGGPDGAVPVVPVDWIVDLRPMGLMSLSATWAPVPNEDVVVYDVYADDQPVNTFDATTFVGTTGGTGLSFGDINGVALEAGVDYHVAVRPRDEDGPAVVVGRAGPVAVRQAGEDSISIGWTYTGPLSADQIETGNLSATIAILGRMTTAAAGRQVSLSSADGLLARDQNNLTIAHIPTDINQDIALTADVVLRTATAEGPVALRHGGNEIAQGGALTLRAAMSAPVSPPSVTIEWGRLENIITAFADWTKNGAYHQPSDTIYVAESVFGSSGVVRYSAATGARLGAFTISSYNGDLATNINAFSVARWGDRIYAHCRYAYGNWAIRIYNLEGVYLGEWALGSDTAWPHGEPAVTINSAGVLVLVFAEAGGQVRRHTYNRDTGAGITEQVLHGLILAGPIQGLVETAADTGAQRLWFTSPSNPGTFYCSNVEGWRDIEQEFNVANNGTNIGFLAWDSSRSRFVSYSRSTGEFHVYDGTTWTGESSMWTVTHTWRDSDAVGGLHETSQGPPATFVMKKRARVRVQVPPIPSDANNANRDDPVATSIYVGRAGGAFASQFRQAQPANAVRDVLLTKVVFNNTDLSRPNPPQFGNFPNGVAAILRSSAEDALGPKVWINGLGEGRMGRIKVVGRAIDTFLSPLANPVGAGATGINIYDPPNRAIPEGAQVARVTLRTAGRSASTCAGYWDLYVKLDGTYTIVDQVRWFNGGDIYHGVGATLTADIDLTQIPAGQPLDWVCNIAVDAGSGGPLSVYFGSSKIDWLAHTL